MAVTTREVRREVLAAAWPVVLQQTVRTLMFFVDTAMLGHYGPAALASMNIVGPLLYTTASVLGAVAIGAVATTARAWGAGDRAKAEGEAATAVAAALAVGTAAAGGAWLLIPGAVGWLAGPGDAAIAGDAAAYLRIVCLSFPFLLLESVGSNVLRACGDTRTPLWIALAANAGNALGNWILIYGNWGAPELGVRGAAISTAVMYAAQGLALGCVLASGASRVRVAWATARRITRESVVRLARVTGPATVEPLILQAGFLVFTERVNALGADAAAAHRIALAIESLSYMPGYGFSIACAALVGQRLGAGDPDGAALRCRETLRLALIVMGILGAVFLVAPGLLVGLFIDASAPGAAAIAASAALCLAIGAFEQPGLGAAMTLQGALRGAGDTRSPVAVAALGVWCVRIPLVILLTTQIPLGLAGAWLTTVADWTVRAALAWWIYRRGRWRGVRL